MPPVGAYVSAFSIMSERWTTSRHRPEIGLDCAFQSRQNVSVSASATSGSMPPAASWCDGIPGQHERHALALCDGELGDRLHVLAARRRGRAERERVGAGDRERARRRRAAPTGRSSP